MPCPGTHCLDAIRGDAGCLEGTAVTAALEAAADPSTGEEALAEAPLVRAFEMAVATLPLTNRNELRADGGGEPVEVASLAKTRPPPTRNTGEVAAPPGAPSMRRADATGVDGD